MDVVRCEMEDGLDVVRSSFSIDTDHSAVRSPLVLANCVK